MLIGIAGALLVFTGIWHATEFMMGGRNKDTLRLIPFGLIYLVLGILLVLIKGGMIVTVLAIIFPMIGMVAAFMLRKTAAVRRWVTWTFIVLDVIIVACLLLALL